MYKLEMKCRFSYSKTMAFWKAIEDISQKHINDSKNFYAIKRDKIMFIICYCYGLRFEEALNIRYSDINIDINDKGNCNDGCIYIRFEDTGNSFLKSRMVYPVFPEMVDEIREYLRITVSRFDPDISSNIFITPGGQQLTKNYMAKRLRYYNSMVADRDKIDSLDTFGMLYIMDLLRFKGVSESFINRQIGNSITNNMIYMHLYPNTCGKEFRYGF